jgi:hypothetical protein
MDQVLPWRKFLRCRKCVDISSNPNVASSAIISVSRLLGVVVRRSTFMSPRSIMGLPANRLHASEMYVSVVVSVGGM